MAAQAPEEVKSDMTDSFSYDMASVDSNESDDDNDDDGDDSDDVSKQCGYTVNTINSL